MCFCFFLPTSLYTVIQSSIKYIAFASFFFFKIQRSPFILKYQDRSIWFYITDYPSTSVPLFIIIIIILDLCKANKITLFFADSALCLKIRILKQNKKPNTVPLLWSFKRTLIENLYIFRYIYTCVCVELGQVSKGHSY